MNKKILTLLMIFVVAISIANVCAVELNQPVQYHGFKMNDTGNDSFGSGIDDPSAHGNLFNSNTTFANDNKTVFIFYYEDSMGNVLDYFKHNSVFTNNATTEGNLTLLVSPTPEMTTNGYNITALAGVSSGDDSKVVFVGSNDLNLVKEYAKTIVFDK